MSDIDVALAEIRKRRPAQPEPDIDAALQEIRQGGSRVPAPAATPRPSRGVAARAGSAIWGALTGVNGAIDRGARGLGRTIARDVAGYRDDPRRQAGADLLRSAQLARGAAHGIVDAPLALLEGAGRLGQRADRAMGIYGGGRAVETIQAVRGALDDAFTEGPTSGYDTAGQVAGGLVGLGGVYGGVEQGVAKVAMGSERLAAAAAGTGTAARIARLARGTGRASRLARSMAANAPVTALLELPEAETSTGHVVGGLLRESDSPTAQRVGGALERGSRTLAGRAAIGLGMDALGNLVHVAFPAHGPSAPAAVAEDVPDLSWLDDLDARGAQAIEARNAPLSPEAPGGAPSTLARTAAAGTRTPRGQETPLDVARGLQAAGERPTARRVASEAGVSETEAQAAVRRVREERAGAPAPGVAYRGSSPVVDPKPDGATDLHRFSVDGSDIEVATDYDDASRTVYVHWFGEPGGGAEGGAVASRVPIGGPAVRRIVEKLGEQYPDAVDVKGWRLTGSTPEREAAVRIRRDAPAPAAVGVAEGDLPAAPIPGADGREATLSFADGTRARVRYRVVEADAVQPSHNPVTFGRNPDYPEGVQGRDYHRDRATQERVAERTVGFDPERLLDPTEMAASGPPVTTPAGLAVAGNERTMLRQRVPEMNPAADQAYRARLAERLPTYGIDPAATEGMERPMLVRELVAEPGQDLTHPETLRDLNTRSDLEVGKVKDPLSDAATRARQMQGGAALQHFADTVTPDQSLRDYLGTAHGRQFVESLVADGVIQRSEISRYVDTRTGALNPTGVGLVEKSLYLSAIPDTSLVEAAPPALLQQLEGAIPHIVQAAQVEGWGLEKALQEALALHVEARGKGLRSVGDLLGNTEMFPREGSEAGDALARFLEGANKRETRDFFARYAEAARLAQRMAQSEDLFGAMPPEQAASFRALIGSRGVAERALVNLVARAGAGAAAGGTAGGNLDEDDPARGALLGAILGGATAAGVSLPFARNADEALARLRGEALRLQEDIRTRPRTEAGFVPTAADELAAASHPADLARERTGMPMEARPGVVPLDTGRLTDAARSVTREAVLPGGRLAEVGAVGDLSATEVQAQQTVSRLGPRVQSGEATPREVEAYREANALLTRAEPMDQASVARATAADVPRGTLPDGETGNLFDQPVPVMDPPATPRPRFYSRLERAVESGQRTAPATQWLKYLDNHPQGIAKGEREWTGVDEWLRSRGTQKVTRDELTAYLAEHRIDIRETVKGAGLDTRGTTNLTARDAGGYWEVRSEDGAFVSNVMRDDAADPAAAVVEARRRLETEPMRAGASSTDTKYAQYTLPGGTDYREVLLTLPPKADAEPISFEAWATEKYGDLSDFSAGELEAAREVFRNATADTEGYRGTAAGRTANEYLSAHWDEPNILAHLRLDDRTLPSGERVLFVEELQSDWHQAGREKGYATKLSELPEGFTVEKRNYESGWIVRGPDGRPYSEALPTQEEARAYGLSHVNSANHVPDAPFKNTEEWAGLGIKRVIDEAVAGGYDRVAWTTGEQQAARYDLRKSVDEISYSPSSGVLNVRRSGERVSQPMGTFTPEELPGVVGKETAERLLTVAPNNIGIHSLRGDGLAVGGEGMKEFYDRMLPRWVERYGKKVGVRVEPVELPMPEKPTGALRYQGPELTDEVLARVEAQFAGEPSGSVQGAFAKSLLARLRLTDNPAQRADALVGLVGLSPQHPFLEAVGGGAAITQVAQTPPPARVHSFRITPELKESVRTNGQVLYTFPGPLLDALKLPAGQVAAGAAGGAALDRDHPLRGALTGAGAVLAIRHGRVMKTVGRLARAERGGELRRVLEPLDEIEIERLADRVERWKPGLAQTMRGVVQERLGPLLSSAEQAERDLAELAKGPLRPVREGVPLVAEHQQAVEAAYEGASRDLRHRIIDELEGRLDTGSEADRTRYLALIDRLESKGYGEAQQLGLPGLSGTLDPEQFVRLEKFALDPVGTRRLTEQVQRAVDEHGLDPKRRVTWDETRETARQLGIDPAFVRYVGKDGAGRMTAAEMLAVRNIVAENIQGIEGVLRTLSEKAGTLLPPEREALESVVAAAEAQNESLLARFVRSRSETGRALNSLKMLANQTMDPIVWEARARKVLSQAGQEFTAEHRAAIRDIIAECA